VTLGSGGFIVWLAVQIQIGGQRLALAVADFKVWSGIELSSGEQIIRLIGREQRGVGIVLKLSGWAGIGEGIVDLKNAADWLSAANRALAIDADTSLSPTAVPSLCITFCVWVARAMGLSGTPLNKYGRICRTTTTAEIKKGTESAGVSEPSVASRVYVPAESRLRLLKWQRRRWLGL